MWLFEKRGFVSVVAYDPKKDRNAKSQFSKIAEQAGTHLLVRARIEADLDFIKEVVPSLLVETDKSADYSFRAVITRKQFKKVMAKSVDEIDYDSHFKEAARDASPKAEGRYNAMMSVWTTMSKLQPHTPYGDWTSSYSGTGWSSGSSKSGTSIGTKGKTGYVSPYGSDAAKAVEAPGALSIADFMAKYIGSKGARTYRSGGGPRRGFKIGDKVIGYFGEGVVTKVEEGSNPDKGGAELVSVVFKPEKSTKETVKQFLSNFLMPAELPTITKVEPITPKAEPEDDGKDSEILDLDWMLAYVKSNPKVKDFNIDRIGKLDDDAFELLTRLQESVGDGSDVSSELADIVYDEIVWESSSDEEKQKIVNEGTAPEKYDNEAVALFSHK